MFSRVTPFQRLVLHSLLLAALLLAVCVSASGVSGAQFQHWAQRVGDSIDRQSVVLAEQTGPWIHSAGDASLHAGTTLLGNLSLYLRSDAASIGRGALLGVQDVHVWAHGAVRSTGHDAVALAGRADFRPAVVVRPINRHSAPAASQAIAQWPTAPAERAPLPAPLVVQAAPAAPSPAPSITADAPLPEQPATAADATPAVEPDTVAVDAPAAEAEGAAGAPAAHDLPGIQPLSAGPAAAPASTPISDVYTATPAVSRPQLSANVSVTPAASVASAETAPDVAATVATAAPSPEVPRVLAAMPVTTINVASRPVPSSPAPRPQVTAPIAVAATPVPASQPTVVATAAQVPAPAVAAPADPAPSRAWAAAPAPVYSSGAAACDSASCAQAAAATGSHAGGYCTLRHGGGQVWVPAGASSASYGC